MTKIQFARLGWVFFIGLVILTVANPVPTWAREQITIAMIAETRDTHLAWQQEMIQAFEAKHPHIKIELISTAGSGLIDKMQAMFISGAQLDIGYHDPYLVVEWAKEGVLEDLRPYIERDKGQFADWAEPFFDLYRVGDGIYALAQDIQLNGIFYNKDDYDSAGLAYPTEHWTYDDLFENARRLVVPAPDGSVSRHGFRIPTGRNWVPTIWAFGGDMVDDWASPTKFIGNTKEVADALQYFNDMVELGVAQDRSRFSSVVNNEFIDRRISMALSNTILFGHLIDTADFAWDVVSLPRGPAGYVPQINAIGWFMFSTSEHKEEAWQVLKFFTSEEALRRRVEIIGNVSPNIAVTREVWIPSYKEPEHRHLLLAGLETARSSWMISREIWDVIAQEAYAVIWGAKPVSSALEEMERLVNGMIGR